MKPRWFRKWGRPPADHYFLTLINGGAPLCTGQRLKARCDEALSDFGFSFNLGRYAKVRQKQVEFGYNTLGRAVHVEP